MLQIDKYDVVLRLTEDLLGTVPRDRDVYTRFIQDRARKEILHQAKKGVPLANGDEATEENVTALMAGEPETIRETEERGWTGFHCDKHGPFLHNYAVKGYLKEAARRIAQANRNAKEEEAEDEDEGDDPRSEAQDKIAASKAIRYQGVDEQEVPRKKAAKKKAGKNPYVQLQDKVNGFVTVLPRRVYFPEGCYDRDESGNPVFECLERPLRAQTAQGPRVTVVRSDLIKAGAEIGFTINVLAGGGVTKKLLEDILEYGSVFNGMGQWRSGGYGQFDVVRLERR